MQIPFSPGKRRRYSRLADDDGRFAMLAIDQRGSLQRMLARHESPLADGDGLRLVKRVVTEATAPLASAVLTDPLFGIDASIDVIPPHVGLLLSIEETGYEPAVADGRLSRLIENWSVERILRRGADAVKLLIWHHPAASEATHGHQQEVVESVGVACTEAEIPFVLEVVTYAMGEGGTKGADFARVKPALVADAAAVYSAPRFAVDLLKLEFPANLKFVDEYRNEPWAGDTSVYDIGVVERACRAVDDASDTPWVILSAGVDPAEFAQNLKLTNAAGASGFLCGRAVWKHVVDYYPDEASMAEFMRRDGRSHFQRLVEANAGALPWHQHRRFNPAPVVTPV